MGAVAWGALLSAIALAILAVRLERWRRTLPADLGPALRDRGDLDGASAVVCSAERADRLGDLLRIDLAGIERAERAEALAFDGIIGHLLLSDPTFADSADRLARQDEPGPAA